jgi:hypothetical protein
MATGNGQQCADQGTFLAEYNRGVTEWARAVRSVSDNAGNEFTVLLSKVDKARAKTRLAKLAYAAPIAEHGC